MELTKTQRLPIAAIIALDAVLATMACLVPAASHLLAAPLYLLNPMLALLLAGMLLGRDWRNALVLAVLLPSVSCLLTGMPAAGKMVCMMAELATVAALYAVLSRRWAVLPAVLVAIVAGKAVYYGLKAAVLAPAVLVGTAWWIQLATVLVWGGLFALLYRKTR
ncbi:MAG: hypothetical protein IJ524_03055 [Bacteroidales bacterium]|nr:hypothetical protein [Bacteroidales bacterium]